MPFIFASSNNISVRTKYVKEASGGIRGTPLISSKSAIGICAAKTARWIQSMKKIGADPTDRDLARTDPGSDEDVAILQSLFGMKYEKGRQEDSSMLWLAKQCEWTVEQGVETDLEGLLVRMGSTMNIPGEWLLVIELRDPPGVRHAIGIATRLVEGQPRYFLYDPNKGLFPGSAASICKMNLMTCGMTKTIKAYRNNVNDD